MGKRKRPAAIATKRSVGASVLQVLTKRTRMVIVADISIKSVVKATLILLAIAVGVMLVIALQHVIILLLLGLFLAAIIDPGVRMLCRWGMPPSLAILIHYAVFLAAALYLIFSLVPVIAEQIGDIASLADIEVKRLLEERTISLPIVSREVNIRLTILLRMALRSFALTGPDALEHVSNYLTGFTAGSLQFLTELAGSVLLFIRDLLVVLLFAFFLQLERERISVWIRRFFPAPSRPYIDAKAHDINEKLGQWIRGQLLLCVVIGGMVFLMLVVLRMPYALTLAILAGFMEFIPYIGPLVGAVPGVMIALAHGGFLWALVVAAAYYIIQFCENNFIVPLIMKRAVNISAVAIMFAMLVGVSFPGIIHPVLGILLSIPFASVVGLFLDDMRAWQRQRNRHHATGLHPPA